MKYLLVLPFIFLMYSSALLGQQTTTTVNPDGTHTTTINNGNTSTQINPDGTHTIIHNNGNTSTQINPDGTHTIIQNTDQGMPQDTSGIQVGSQDREYDHNEQHQDNLTRRELINYGIYILSLLLSYFLFNRLF